MESNIMDVEADTSHVFFSQNTVLGGPLECSFARILDFVHELALSSDINKQVSTSGFGTKAPNFLCIVGIPSIVILENLVADLNILLGINLF